MQNNNFKPATKLALQKSNARKQKSDIEVASNELGLPTTNNNNNLNYKLSFQRRK